MHAFIRAADRALYWFIVLQVAAMAAVVLLQVFNRYVVNHVFGWEEETARYLMVWSSFLAAAYALLEGEQLGMEFIVSRLPVVGQRVLRTVCHLLVMAFLGVVAYQGLFVLMPQQLDQISPALGVTMALPYAAIPVSAIMLLLVDMRLLWREWHGAAGHPAPPAPLQL